MLSCVLGMLYDMCVYIYIYVKSAFTHVAFTRFTRVARHVERVEDLWTNAATRLDSCRPWRIEEKYHTLHMLPVENFPYDTQEDVLSMKNYGKSVIFLLKSMLN